MTTLAILPVKRFDAAKQRLGEALAPGVRRALAQAMLTDVLIQLRRCASVDGVLVVTGEREAQQIAVGHDAEFVDDPEDSGQSPAALRGLARARELGCTRALLVPGDCPALHPDEVEAMLAEIPVGQPGAAIVPDRHGTGTNALVLTPIELFEPAFGPGSFARHVERARTAGVEPHLARLDSLALDVDTPDDLEALRAALAERRGQAANTRGLLAQLSRQQAASTPTG